MYVLCVLLIILYLPIGIILDVTKKQGGGMRRGRRGGRRRRW